MAFYRLGLIGAQVDLSFSPAIHRAFFQSLGLEGSYELFNLSSENLAVGFESLIAGGINGLNVTVPHKLAVVPFLQSLSGMAVVTGAVNTIVRPDAQGAELVGYNTDVAGLTAGLRRTFPALANRNREPVVIIGLGGAARAAVASVLELGFEQIVLLGRRCEAGAVFMTEMQENLARAGMHKGPWRLHFCLTGARQSWPQSASLVINASTIGHKSVDAGSANDAEKLWLVDLLQQCGDAVAMDLVYSPNREPTLFCKYSQQAGLASADGKAMLVEQARQAFALWTGQMPAYETGLSALERALQARA